MSNDKDWNKYCFVEEKDLPPYLKLNNFTSRGVKTIFLNKNTCGYKALWQLHNKWTEAKKDELDQFLAFNGHVTPTQIKQNNHYIRDYWEKRDAQHLKDIIWATKWSEIKDNAILISVSSSFLFTYCIGVWKFFKMMIAI